jgi:hypothetical protein
LGALSALFDALGPQAKYDEISTLFRDLERPADPELLNAWLDCVVNATAYLALGGDSEVRARTLALLEESRDRLDPILIGRALHAREAHGLRDNGNCVESHCARPLVCRQITSGASVTDEHACECTWKTEDVFLLEVGLLEEAERLVASRLLP